MRQRAPYCDSSQALDIGVKGASVGESEAPVIIVGDKESQDEDVLGEIKSGALSETIGS